MRGVVERESGNRLKDRVYLVHRGAPGGRGATQMRGFSNLNSRLYPYTAERRDVLGNTPPEAREISQGRGFCTPRPRRWPKGDSLHRGTKYYLCAKVLIFFGRGGCRRAPAAAKELYAICRMVLLHPRIPRLPPRFP